MRILGWKVEGLRCPDHEINCRTDDGEAARITLIQMPNGTGKTTTLSLLRAALSGQALSWLPQYVRGMCKKGNEEGKGKFELQLEVNDKRLTIVLEFNFDLGRVYYKTTWGSGQQHGFEPPRQVKPFMNEQFVNFYIFDGELAENLLSPKHTHAEKAVESLFQINLLSDMRRKVEGYWEEASSNSTSKDQRGLSRRLNLLRKWKDREQQLENEKQTLEEDVSNIKAALKKQSDDYSKELGKEQKRAQDIEAAEARFRMRDQNVDELAKKLLANARAPQALSASFAKAMLELKMGLDRLKLPKSAAREFFQELAEEELCVCGRGIDEEVRIAILDRAQHYLGEDNVTLLNSMKSMISEFVEPGRELLSKQLQQEITELGELVRSRDVAKNDWEELEEEAASSDPELKKVRQARTQLEAKEKELSSELAAYTESKTREILRDPISKIAPSQIKSIEAIKKGISELEARVDDARETLDMRQRRDVLMLILERAHRKSRDAITEEIKEEANNRISDLMPHNDIRIAEIKGSLRLEGQSGGSVGETLSVGYAFLSTLFNRTDQHQLPFVVDSPANPIDLDIRPNIGALIPRLTDQFIAFVISSERDRFLPNLKQSGAGKTLFFTLFRKGAESYDEAARANSACIETADGYCVKDEEFFDAFQLDMEEE